MQLCSQAPGDDTRAEGRSKKAKLLQGARPQFGQSAHRSRKDFWPTISCDRSPSPKTKLREGGRVKKRSPNDPARQGAPVDNRAAGTQLADHPMARQFSSLQDSFPILLTRISRDNEAGRFSMGQMKFTKLHISSRQPNRETYTGGFVVPLAGLRIKRVSATIRKNN